MYIPLSFGVGNAFVHKPHNHKKYMYIWSRTWKETKLAYIVKNKLTKHISLI